MGNRTSKHYKSKAGKQEKSVNAEVVDSSTDMEDDIPLIESVSAPLIAEIEEAYVLKNNGGFKRLFHCVTSSLVCFSAGSTECKVTVILNILLHIL